MTTSQDIRSSGKKGCSGRLFLAVLVILVVWNVAWPLGASIRSRCRKITSSRKYDGSFHSQFVLSKRNSESDIDYVKNPLVWPFAFVGDNVVIDVDITSVSFTVSTSTTNGDTFVDTYSIGEDVFYLGDGLFTFYSSDFGLGVMSPGTVYSDTACKITVADKTVSIEATENHVGMGFWLFPIVQQHTFRRSLESRTREKEEPIGIATPHYHARSGG